MDDELEMLKSAHAPRELSSWNIEDLQDYKDRLLAEIDKIDDEIKSKKEIGSQAQALFKS